MPQLPKWLADGMETLLSSQMHSVQVSHVEYLDPKLKQVRFSGDLGNASFAPGQVIEFRINDTSFRHYTPSFYHQQQGVCDVLFYLHGLGPGSQWAEALTVGANTKLMGPGGKMKYRSEQDLHFFFGDESSLGLCHNLQHTANTYGHSYRCLLELDAEHQHWPALISLHTDIVEKSEKEPAKESIQTIEGLSKEAWEKWKKATYYLTGRAKSIQKIRRALLGRGIPTKQILTYPYWADGKKGL